MDHDVKSLADAARALSPEDQDALIDMLLDAGDEAGATWSATWATEAEARLAEVQRGDVETLDADDVAGRRLPSIGRATRTGMKIRFHPRARAELYRAAEWYDRRQIGLGDEFYAEVAKSFAQMRAFPGAQPEILPGWRRALPGGFPYGLVYRELGPEVLIIVAIAHSKRRPGYWRRLKIKGWWQQTDVGIAPPPHPRGRHTSRFNALYASIPPG